MSKTLNLSKTAIKTMSHELRQMFPAIASVGEANEKVAKLLKFESWNHLCAALADSAATTAAPVFDQGFPQGIPRIVPVEYVANFGDDGVVVTTTASLDIAKGLVFDVEVVDVQTEYPATELSIRFHIQLESGPAVIEVDIEDEDGDEFVDPREFTEKLINAGYTNPLIELQRKLNNGNTVVCGKYQLSHHIVSTPSVDEWARSPEYLFNALVAPDSEEDQDDSVLAWLESFGGFSRELYLTEIVPVFKADGKLGVNGEDGDAEILVYGLNQL